MTREEIDSIAQHFEKDAERSNQEASYTAATELYGAAKYIRSLTPTSETAMTAYDDDVELWLRFYDDAEKGYCSKTEYDAVKLVAYANAMLDGYRKRFPSTIPGDTKAQDCSSYLPAPAWVEQLRKNLDAPKPGS